MSHKQDLLNRAAEEYRAFHEAIEGLNETQLTAPWLGAWSIKEIVAHMIGWHGEMTPALRRMARGERPFAPGSGYDDVDTWNAKFAEARRHLPVIDVLLEFDRSHAEFLKAADAVAEDRYQPEKTAYRIVDLNGGHHYKEHGDEIRAWRQARGV